ncbi:MAG: FecR domain-containing protein [bacterium]|nr:FecR domain-containing protein [bacterium]
MAIRKYIIYFIIIAAALTGLFYLFLPALAGVGNLDIYSGAVDVLRGDQVKNGQTGENVKINDTVRTKNESRSGLVLKDNTIVRFESGSEVKVGDIEYKDGKIKDAVFALLVGQIWTSAQPVGEGGQLRVETPTVVASVRGTEFEVIYRNGITEIFVFEGSVVVALASDPSVFKEVKAGEYFVISDSNAREDFEKGPVLFDINERNDWVIFNLGEADKDSVPTTIISPSLSPTPEITNKPSPTATLKPTVSPTPKPTVQATPTPIVSPTPPTSTGGGVGAPTESVGATPTPNPEPQINSVTPNSVSRSSDSNSFFINGDNLKNPVQVYLGEFLIQSFLIDSQTIIGYVSENIQPGVYDVVVITAGKTLTLNQALTIR